MRLRFPSDKHFPEEYLALMRTTLPGRFQHHCTAVTHPIIATKAAEFDDIQLAAYSYVVGHFTPPTSTLRWSYSSGARGAGAAITR